MQLFRTMMFGSLTLLLVVGFAPLSVQAQPAPIPLHQEPYRLYSGLLEGIEARAIVPFREVVQVSGVPWVRLHFKDYNLGTSSYVKIISLADGGEQILTADSLPLWQNSSAFFNGDAVEVELSVAPGETGIFISIEEITVGEWAGGETPESICGTADNRVSSTDPREGRIVPIGCTGWIVSNGAYLTAGHCAGGGGSLLEFNVPDSLADGTIRHPDPEDQYPIVWGSSYNGGSGNDWAVFNCSPNSTTKLTPVQAQHAFFRMSRDYSSATGDTKPSTVRVTGYGVDGPAPDFGADPDDRNSDNQTLQTHAGPYYNEVTQAASDVYHQYQVDTMGGNSGSPIIVEGTLTTIGIHTHGGCSSGGGYNKGTSFEHNNLENAIETFPGSNVVYADVGHPVSSAYENGTVLRPYNTVAEAASAVSSGGIISVVAGSYSKAAGNTFTLGSDGRSMTIVAPVGTVYIGY